jgi:Transglycosylase SLT domain
MDGGSDAGDRRQRTDRRAQAGGDHEGRRGTGGAAKPKAKGRALTFVLRSLGAVAALVIVIVFTMRLMHPIYATQGTLGDELRKHAPEAAAAIGAFDSTNVNKLMATAKFQEEKRNFYEDVMRLKQVDSARADSIAQFAVREAYIQGISPAIIFGVMLTENAKFVSKAQSNVGAVGLMQVYPKVWLTKEMTSLFGRDLASDSTNVKYGVFILSHYFNPKTKSGATTERDWATALLRYNGCVNGTNTPRCHTYPSKVQGFVEKQATSICNGRGFYDCIAKPFIDGLFTGGKLTPDQQKTDSAAAQVGGAAVPAPVMSPMPASVLTTMTPPAGSRSPPPTTPPKSSAARSSAARSTKARRATLSAKKKKHAPAKTPAPKGRTPLPAANQIRLSRP